jgi:hypothetical protein
MPIDPSIILGIKTPRIEQTDPLDSYAKVLGLKSAIAQGGMQDLQMQQARQGMESDQRIRKLLGENPSATAEQIMAIDPKTGMAYAKNRAEIAKSEATAGRDRALGNKAELETSLRKMENGAALLHVAQQNPSAWPSVRNLFMMQNPNAQLPEHYDPDLIAARLAQGQTITQQLTQEHQRAVLDEQRTHNRATESNTVRGQNLTDVRAREGLDIKASEATATQYIQTPEGVLALPRKAPPGTAPVGNMVVTPQGEQVLGQDSQKRQLGASRVLSLLDEAEKLIPKGTNSYVGAGVDLAARAVGGAPAGAVAIGQLKAIEGALLSEMPRMEGPQSNYDVQNYKQAAANLGDPTIPNKVKMEGLKTIREIQKKYQKLETTQKPSAPAVPSIGERRGGYIFKGGDPGNQNSWEAIR